MPPTRSPRYLALACDYDGTIATAGRVTPQTIDALERLRASGRKLILVTGRDLESLQSDCDRLDLFHRVVAENGALLYRPDTREEKTLAPAPPPGFLAALETRGVDPIFVGRAIVATRTPHEAAVIDAIRALGLELHVIFNRNAVMVLPSGVNKLTGLNCALEELGLSIHNVAGIGDAENDHAFLAACECAAAVANALPALREAADYVTAGPAGEGAREFIDRILADDLEALERHLERHWIPIGRTEEGEPVRLPPVGERVLVAGTSGSGKTTLVFGILERLIAAGYQVCLFDPEGDYETVESVVRLGAAERPPSEEEALQILLDPKRSVSVRLIALPMPDRPAFFGRLLPRILELRARLGRPHAIFVDEAHHLLPATWDPAVLTVPAPLDGLFLITVHPEHISQHLLEGVDVAIALGEAPGKLLRNVAALVSERIPAVGNGKLESGRALVWMRRDNKAPFEMRIEPGRADRRRHMRKYAEGELPPERSFFFRGQDGKLNLRAQNLTIFLQMAEGVDDATWDHHLRRGDYSQWFREKIKDDDLAKEAERVESAARGLDAKESRARIRKLVEERYSMPA